MHTDTLKPSEGEEGKMLNGPRAPKPRSSPSCSRTSGPQEEQQHINFNNCSSPQPAAITIIHALPRTWRAELLLIVLDTSGRNNTREGTGRIISSGKSTRIIYSSKSIITIHVKILKVKKLQVKMSLFMLRKHNSGSR